MEWFPTCLQPLIESNSGAIILHFHNLHFYCTVLLWQAYSVPGWGVFIVLVPKTPLGKLVDGLVGQDRQDGFLHSSVCWGAYFSLKLCDFCHGIVIFCFLCRVKPGRSRSFLFPPELRMTVFTSGSISSRENQFDQSSRYNIIYLLLSAAKLTSWFLTHVPRIKLKVQRQLRSKWANKRSWRFGGPSLRSVSAVWVCLGGRASWHWTWMGRASTLTPNRHTFTI